MTKKIISILLLICMTAVLPACTKDNTEEPIDTAEVADTTTAEDEPKFPIPEDAVLTDTQRAAAESAEEALNGTGISRSKLVEFLLDEGHSSEDAEYVVDIFGIDWNEMARGTAEFYTYYMPFSYQGLVEHLEYMGFTPEEAKYGADQLEMDWDANVSKYIEKYYLYDTYGYDDLVAELEKAGFTHDQAINGIKDYEEQLAEDSSIREEYGLDG